jgi:hypothetical protein
MLPCLGQLLRGNAIEIVAFESSKFLPFGSLTPFPGLSTVPGGQAENPTRERSREAFPECDALLEQDGLRLLHLTWHVTGISKVVLELLG